MTATTPTATDRISPKIKHPWGHILWRDRLIVLGTMALLLLTALGLIALFPRDYVARTVIAVSPDISVAEASKINWAAEAEFMRGESVMRYVQDQLFPIQSQKQFESFRALKLPSSVPVPAATNTAQTMPDLQQKLFIFVHNEAQQNSPPLPAGLVIETRSSNPAEAAQLARVMVESYLMARQDRAAKDNAQKNAWVRTELLKKRKALIEAQALYTQYYRENGLELTAAKDALTETAIAIEDTKANLAENETRYGPKHPVIIELKARLKALETAVSEARTPNDHTSLVQQTLDQLMQDVQTARGDLDQFIKQHGAGLSSVPSFADQILLRAQKLTIRPDHQFDRILIGIFALCGFMLGLLIVVLRHVISPTLQSPEDAPRLVSALPRVGHFVPVKDFKHFTDTASIMNFKTMRHDIRLRFQDPKLVVLSSDHDGQTALEMGLGLARASAKSGEKSILIEANWHRCYLHNMVPNTKNRTLIDYVAGSATLESILYRDDPSGAHILFGGEIPMTAVDLLSGTKFSNLLLSFRQIYDLVVIVAPPVAIGADARLLSRMADVTLLTMVADGSHPSSLSSAVTILNQSNIKDMATIWVGRQTK